MSDTLSIVLEDQHVLSELCGVNDTNLRVMEGLLNARVLTRGNELFLESESSSTRQVFRNLIEGLKSHVRSGQVPGPDLIKAEYRSITQGSEQDRGDLHGNQIVLPNGIKVFPRSLRQAQYIAAMNSQEISFSIGPAGTGKTYLAVAHALKDILGQRKRRLLLTRPVVEAGESLGFLPGDLTQKLNPYLRPLYDAMDSFISVETITRMEQNRLIEIAPLAYMRGRSLRDSYIILDEAQNTTKEQMKMFLTRLGEGSKAVITGDITQIDLPRKDQSGLLHALRILSGIRDIHFTHFDATDVVRHPLVRKIIHAYESESQT